MRMLWCLRFVILAVLLVQASEALADLRFFWRAEGETLSGTDDFSVGDTTATQQPASGPAISATAALVGSNGVLIDASGEHYRFDNTGTAIISPSAGSVGFWVRFQTWSTTATTLYARGASANDFIQINGTATNEIRLQIGNSVGPTTASLNTTAVNIANDTTYFLTASWDDTADLRRICVYDSGGTLVEACTTSAAAFTGPADLNSTTSLRIGDAAGATTAFYVDNIFVGSLYADADLFFTNRSIASHTSYATGSGCRGALMLMGVGGC